MTEIEENDWDIVIEKKKSLLDLQLKQVWEYRDLLVLFVRRDFVSFYKQTILGPVWFFIQPVFTTIIYLFLFRNLAKLSTDEIPGPLFYISGITIWSYFSETLLKTSNVLRDNAGIFGKVYFPRLIMPLSIACSGLFKFGVQLSLLALIMLYYVLLGGGLDVPWQIVFFPFLVIIISLQALGIGMLVSALASKYRDLALLLGFGLQLLMFASPIVYPLSSLSGTFKILISVNPLTGIIETVRYCLFRHGTVDPIVLLYSIFFTIGSFLLGIIVYNRTERSFVDTV
ncbi:MAG: ABC transporter permease [Bacteroidetes bacterium]|nr:ABC transporter permease [Bacteroidota bacterium]MBU1371224.1 ABC transporter permease [Bacteroidota bacterium]MBU1483801.1 ABC transporter permease [Bacteroidota bacterium]MBU1760049.1 ABC transporter permease [Bacteroidota bacterium]MBU2266763.1 ABC transporter permease [Bacteroidota bacterium]